MKTILLQNNIVHAIEHMRSADKILFAPLYKSKIQKQFHLKRFDCLKSYFPKIEWCEQIMYSEFDIAYACDAHYEKQTFKKKLSPIQNRLFDQLPFIVPNGFATFRERIETYLPDHFNNSVEPIDFEVIEHLKNYFLSQAPSQYFETRNQLLGENYSTGISRFLSTGHLDVRYVYNCVKKYEKLHGSNKSTQWIIYELLWREYFYWHYQRHTVNYFSRAGIKGLRDFSPYFAYETDQLRNLTQIPFWHAALNELISTGHMSNRARQIFASIWINDLQLDWRSGANFFQDYLLDYDVYSNWGNWMYLAGVGVDPRGKRYFNVDKQLDLYDPSRDYITTWKNQ